MKTALRYHKIEWIRQMNLKRNAALPVPWTGEGGGQDFLATGRGQWYRDGSSDQTTKDR
ncbi:MAG: hypothetical protein ABIJ25_08210 [Pseudomonadota bacterium]